jgi:hypothetical protein
MSPVHPKSRGDEYENWLTTVARRLNKAKTFANLRLSQHFLKCFLRCDHVSAGTVQSLTWKTEAQ